jgi:hypothetical protein
MGWNEKWDRRAGVTADTSRAQQGLKDTEWMYESGWRRDDITKSRKCIHSSI